MQRSNKRRVMLAGRIESARPSTPLLQAARVMVVALCVTVGLACADAPARAQEAGTDSADAQAQITERAQSTVSILEPLLELEASLEDQIADANEVQPGEDEEAIAVELERLRTELQAVQSQITQVVAGVSDESYTAVEQTGFDLNAEIQDLIEPFVLVLNEATSDARQLERARRDLDLAARRFEDASIAVANIEAILEQVEVPAVVERLNKDLALWQERLTAQETQIEALTQRIDDLRADRIPVGRNVNSAFEVFFRDRGISLALGLGAFVGVILLGRLVHVTVTRALSRRQSERTFAMRLGEIVFLVVTAFASFGAMLAVFNLRNDWLLLALAVLLFLAALWVLIRMLPALLEQISVLLNLGAVQESERVLFNGVPYKVQRLSFFTDLVNPALDGGEFTLPVRELVGMHSRPAAEDESWFPSEKGDWVRLSDGNAGQVVAQTPEMVVVQLLGGARVTYQTTDYLAANPENLSHGYRAEVEFGIAYKHQKESTGAVIEIMRAGIDKHFRALLGDDEIVDVDVELLRAGTSSIDYEVEVDVAGTSAHLFETVERELARCLIDLANANGWEIPFQQVVLHRAEND